MKVLLYVYVLSALVIVLYAYGNYVLSLLK